MSANSSCACNQIATKPSQRFGTLTVECPRRGDVRKYSVKPKSAPKNQKTTICHFGFTEKVYELPCTLLGRAPHWQASLLTRGTRHERFGVAANVETKWHTRRTSLKPLQLDGFTLSVPDKESATISVCCCMKCGATSFDDLKRFLERFVPLSERCAVDVDCLKMTTSTVWLWRKLPCLKCPHRSGPCTCMQSF